MEIVLLILGISVCVAALLGLLWTLKFLLSPEDHIDSDWYTDDEEP
jgi:hypothetical protein